MKIFAILALIVVCGIGAFALFAWRSEIEPVDAAAKNFDPAMVKKGAELAALGNCIACHTVPGNRAFSGGLGLPTPFGVIHSSNITPDRETGIGTWSEVAFQRAMHEGVDREGEHLYPAFPYDHFTQVSEEDNRAIYAYLMTREPVSTTHAGHHVMFPLGFRPLLAGWKLLFLNEGPFRPDPNRSAELNRGAYLAEGLGHCGACHSPRNSLGAEDKDRHFAGGEAEGWVAYAIGQTSYAPIPWDKEAIAFYLRHGWHELHGVAHGPMAEVVGNLADLSDKDVEAIAAYVASLMGRPDAKRKAAAERLQAEISGPGASAAKGGSQAASGGGADMAGAAIYASACALCHEGGRAPPYGGLDFRLSTAVNAPNPQNIINVTLFGLPPADGEASAVMPGFAASLDDRQIANLLAFIRKRFSNGTAWDGIADMVRRTRSGEHKVAVRPADSIERAPVNVGAKE